MKTPTEKSQFGEKVSFFIITLLSAIYKNENDIKLFSIELCKYMDDENYIADKMWEFPGKNLKAETALREVIQALIGRRF